MLLLSCRTSQPEPALPPADVLIEFGDNGHAVAGRVGDLVRVSLGVDFGWAAVQVSDPSVLAPVAQPALPRGTQLLLRAVKPGIAAIETRGDAQCAPRTPCPAMSVTYRVTVDVR